jgi:hypothetical protein
MKDKTRELFEVNSDITSLLEVANNINWNELRESSIHRILYLSSVLYGFIYTDNKIYSNYHFSLSPKGPFSEIINRSIIDLRRREIVEEDKQGNLTIVKSISKIEKEFVTNEKSDWFQIIIFILGLYGEDKIFAFVIQDPQYNADFHRNSQKEIDISDQNVTVKTLRKFQNAFEETLENVSQIDKREYLELYFEYVFSKIIKKA